MALNTNSHTLLSRSHSFERVINLLLHSKKRALVTFLLLRWNVMAETTYRRGIYLGLWFQRTESSVVGKRGSKRQAWQQEQEVGGSHLEPRARNRKGEPEVCRGSLKARLQWLTSSSWDPPPNPPQTALPARDPVFKYGSTWAHSYSNQYKQYELNHTLILIYVF